MKRNGGSILIMLFTKARFRSLLSSFITHFILIITELVLGSAHFQSSPYKTLLKIGQTRAQNGGPTH